MTGTMNPGAQVRLGPELGLFRRCSNLWPGPMFRRRLSILIYHRVLSYRDPLMPGEVCADQFRWHLELLRRHFSVLPLGEAVERLRRNSLPHRAICITFDDGYADNFTMAVPMLREQGLSATFFVATAFLDGGRMWNDTVIEALRRAPSRGLDLRDMGLPDTGPLTSSEERRQAIETLLPKLKYQAPAQRLDSCEELARRSGADLPDDLMMSSDQVRGMRSLGMEVGAHTRSHPILTTQQPEEARREICGGREELESLLGERVSLFAYPNGKPGKDYDEAHVRMVTGAGFDAAVSTRPGVSHSATSLWELPRFTPWDRSPTRFMLRLFRNIMNPV